jgi:UDP-N-acetylglucosamine--N-acetylmuramyl-(pentapeptide) pyrophosphoryl-undecaprenol N-acetylglucosamine transferase
LKWVDGEDLSEVFKKADLVISRAGANTLSELAYFSIPTIVIPIPYLYKNEQNRNAKFFSEAGLCEVIPQDSLSSEKLLSKIKEFLKNIKKYKESAKNSKSLVILDADKRLSQEVLKFL